MNIENPQWKLMHDDAITLNDRKQMCEFILSNKKLSYGEKVKEFEKKWSEWQGCKYSVFVNSGASANLLTMLALRIVVGTGEVIVPTLTWISDIASVIQNNFKPVFVDINPKNLAMCENDVLKKITKMGEMSGPRRQSRHLQPLGNSLTLAAIFFIF